MGLEIPDLDDRTYAELREDAQKRLPVHAPEWTDHNAHDPGITILELLAWLAETHTYQLDRVSDAHRRKYLDLVGVEARPPQPASVALIVDVPRPGESDDPDADDSGGPPVLTDSTTLDSLDGIRIEPGTKLVAETPVGRRERFQTDEAVALSTAQVAAVVSEHGGERVDHTTANDSDGMSFPVFGDDPSPGDALYLGFDADPFAAPQLDLWLDYHDDDLPDPASHGDEAVDFEPSLRCVWEHCTRPEDWYFEDTWDPVPVERDETDALYRGGRVTLMRPDGWLGEVARVAEHDAELFWLRVRLAPVEPEPVPTGVCDPPDRPPAPAPRYEVPPRLNGVAVNVLRATHRDPRTEGELSTPDGQTETSADPNQTFELGTAPVLDATISVGGEAWTQADDFDASGPDDRHYVIDRAAGTVTFGDGRRGAIPEAWQPVSAEFVAGGGPDGNLPADAEWAVPGTDRKRLDVRPLAPPSGGTGPESVEEALVRAHAERRVPHRAVSAADFEYLATHTPGLRFGRAALAEPPGDGEPGLVVVAPYSPPGRLPVPSGGFLAAVERHLCGHVLLTERVDVVGPTFVDVAVTVEIEPEPGVDADVASRDTRERVEDFLEPLTGFDGEGWPFGRPVYLSELYEQVETVDRVADAVDVGVRTLGEVAMADRSDTLPNLVAVDVAVHDEGERCGRGF